MKEVKVRTVTLTGIFTALYGIPGNILQCVFSCVLYLFSGRALDKVPIKEKI